MAEKRISELTAKGSNLQSTDLIEVSVSAGGGAYNTRYITGAQITGAVSSANFANTNLTFTASRTHDLDGYDVTFQDVGTYKMQSNANNDLTYSINYNTLRSASATLNGFIAHNDNGNQAKVAFRSASSGVGYIDSKDRFVINANWDGGASTNGGYSGGAVNSIVVSNGGSNGNVAFGWNPNVAVPYRLTNFGDLGLISTSDSLVKLLFNPTTASYVINNMPTSASGLPSGSLWNDSGTVKIV